jgi:hypothetical protein
MHFGNLLIGAVAGVALALAPQGKAKPPAAGAKEAEALVGTWYYAGVVTPDLPDEHRSPVYGSVFIIRVEADAVVIERPRSGKSTYARFKLDGSETFENESDGKAIHFGRVVDGALHATWRLEAPGKEKRVVTEMSWVYKPVADGLHVALKAREPGENDKTCLYRRKEQIETREPVAAKADAMAWLAGNWTGTRGKSSIEERWSEPKGGALLGTSRTVSGGRMTAFEFLRVVEKNGRLLYVAQPGGSPPTEFTLVELDESRAVFENPFHDYPQRISYERADDQLTAEISFVDGGSPQRFDFKQAK